MGCYTTREICDRVNGRLDGPGDLEITGVEQLAEASSSHISFIRNAHHAKGWEGSHACAAVVTSTVEIDPGQSRALIRVDDADLALVSVLKLFAPPVPRPAAGVHPSSRIDPSAELGRDVAIGPGCDVGRDTKIGPGSILHANVFVSENVTLGPRCELFPGVVIRERCELGARVVIQSNAVIGTEGFGYRPAREDSGWVKIPQIGFVRIGDDVDIGAGTCIDRGKFSATVIGRGTKIDNLCQIAHNCQIGQDCVLAGQVGLAGGVKIEDGAVLAGQAGVAEHVTIGAGARLAARAAVMHDVPPGETWGGYPAREMRSFLREFVAVRRLSSR